MTHSLKFSSLGMVAAAACLVSALPAAAQQSAGAGLEEIVVTARRVEENLQTVPLAITVLNEERLKDQGIKTSFDLTKAIPGVTMCCYRNAVTGAGGAGATGKPNVWIRGVTGLVTYFNDVPISSTEFGTGVFFDMANFQALKGPQGTLFGQPANAGAFVFNSRRPTEKFEGFVSGGFGSRGHHEFEAVLNAPIIADKLYARIGGKELHDGGYIYDEYQGKWLSDTNAATFRGQLLFKPSDRIENLTLVQYTTSHNNGDPAVMSTIDPNGASAFWGSQRCIPGTTICTGPLLAGFNAYAAREAALFAQYGPYRIPGIKNAQGGTRGGSTQWIISDTLQYAVTDDITFKNIFGYVRTRARPGTGATLGMDSDASFVGISAPGRLPNGEPAPISPTDPNFQFSDEAQLLGKLVDGRLSYVLGTFHEWSYTDGPFATGFGTDSLRNQIVTGRVKGDPGYYGPKMRTHGYFGNLNFEVTDGLHVSGGYRYTTDYRIAGQVYNLNPATLQPNPSTPNNPNPPTRVTPSRSKGGSYTFSVTYEVAPKSMIFATYSKGFYPEVINNQAALPQGLVQVPKETPDTVEAGIKSDFNLGDMQLRTNLTGFAYWYKNMQVSAPLVYNRTDTGAPAIAGLILNVPDVKVRGIDGEFTLIPTRDLEVTGAFEFVSTKVPKRFTRGDGAVQGANGKLIGVPDWKVNAGFTYHLPFINEAQGDVSFSANYSWQNGYLGTPVQEPVGGFKDGDQMSPFGMLDLTARWKNVLGHQGLEATLSVTNVTETYHSSGTLPTCAVPIIITALAPFGYPVGGLTNGVCGIIPQEPRTYTVRVRYEF